MYIIGAIVVLWMKNRSAKIAENYLIKIIVNVTGVNINRIAKM